MVVSIHKATEVVVVAPVTPTTETSVYSVLNFDSYRNVYSHQTIDLEIPSPPRYKEEVKFKPQLSPVKYQDTVYVYINSTKKRFLSKTFYEPRVKPKTFAETNYTCPKTLKQNFVSYLDHSTDVNRRWFKTAVELKQQVKARKFRSVYNRMINVSRTDINSNTVPNANETQDHLPSIPIGDPLQNGGVGSNQPEGVTTYSEISDRFKEIYDPGASQVFIPQRKETEETMKLLMNGDITLNFPNCGVDLQYEHHNGHINGNLSGHLNGHHNGPLLDFSDI